MEQQNNFAIKMDRLLAEMNEPRGLPNLNFDDIDDYLNGNPSGEKGSFESQITCRAPHKATGIEKMVFLPVNLSHPLLVTHQVRPMENLG